MSDTFDFVIGQKSMYELEATVDYNNLAFTYLKRSLPIYAMEDNTIKPGKSKDIVLELKEIPFEVHGYKEFPKDGVATVAKLKSAKENQMVQTLILHLGENGKTTVQLSNHSSESWKIHEGEMMGCLDMRSSGYFHISREHYNRFYNHPLGIIVPFSVKEKQKSTLICIIKITEK